MNKGFAEAKKILRYLTPLILLAIWIGFNNCGGKLGGGLNINTANETVLGNPMSPDGIAALPQVYLNSSYPSRVSSSRTLTVGTGKQYSDCQPAVDAANPGDVVAIDAGFVCSRVDLSPKDPNDNRYIILQTANLSSLPPEGTRLSSSDYPNLAIIQTSAHSAIWAQPGAHHYYLVGLEVRVDANASLPKESLIEVGDPQATTLAGSAHDIVIARSYIHGNANQDISKGIEFNGAAISVVDSVISEIHSMNSPGRGINTFILGAGPFKVNNNFISSSGGNFASASETTIPGLIPSDIEFQHNTLTKDLSWQKSTTSNLNQTGLWIGEALVLLVNSQRMLINGNAFSNAYKMNQIPGVALDIKPSSGNGKVASGTVTWDRVQDLTFTNNVISYSAGAIRIDYCDPTFPSVVAQRLDFNNNLGYGIDSKFGVANGIVELEDLAQGPVEFNHNTFLDVAGSGPALLYGGTGGNFAQFTFINNIMNDENQGIYSVADGTGYSTLLNMFPGIVLNANVLIGQTSSNYGPYAQGNYFPPNLASVGFLVDPTNGVTNYLNLALSSQSPYAKKATDGSDIGVNVNSLLK